VPSQAPDVEARNRRIAELLPISALQGGSQNLPAVNDGRRWTHLRLNIFPMAASRFRHGDEAWLSPPDGQGSRSIWRRGGVSLICNDMFSAIATTRSCPGERQHGRWLETRCKRSRPRLAGVVPCPRRLPGGGRHNHFAQLSGSVLARSRHLPPGVPASSSEPDDRLAAALAADKLEAHKRFSKRNWCRRASAHVWLNIYPDGGISG
jgi:allantoicase